jgi:uncharacterized protein (DUF1501 family)
MTGPTQATCGCPEQQALSRRGFLKGLALAGGAAAAAPVLSTRVAYAADGAPGDVLVVLSLRGGMDGLSVVAPVGDPDYARLRPSIAVPGASGIGTGDRLFALHPAMAPLKPLWDAGTLGAVHAVGTPDGSRSHFRATEELERAAPGSTIRSGWLDRVVGSSATGAALETVQLGPGTVPTMLHGPTPELSALSLKEFTLAQSTWVGPRMATALRALHQGVDGPSVRAARSTLGALDAVAGVAAAAGPQNGAAYPDSDLARGLSDAARLIRHGAGLRTVCLDYGDWDMHADLGRGGTGWMAEQAGRLAQALAAFAQDLGPLMGRVTLVTVSEFGRRVAENGSGGVDHGYANAMLLMGGGVVGGRVHGRWPGLTAAALDRGDLAGTTDYRDVLGEVLTRRCGLSAAALADVFPGHRLAPLEITRL